MTSETRSINLNTPELVPLMSVFREIAGELFPEIPDNSNIELSDVEAALLQLIPAVRKLAAQFPSDISDDLFLEIDQVEAGLRHPDYPHNLPQIIERITAVTAWIFG
jgi:internalin A